MEWIEVDEKKPPQNVYVFVAFFDSRDKVKSHFVRQAYRLGRQWFDDNDEEIPFKYGFATHWMPIPDVPGTVIEPVPAKERHELKC